MKLNSIAAAGVILLSLVIQGHSAAVVSYSATAAPSSNPDGSGSTNVWTTNPTSNGSTAGSFLGDSASNGDGVGAGAGSSAWALYAHSGTGNQSFAAHTFSGGALTVGQTVSLDFDNGYFANGETRSAGIQLRNGNTVLFALYFRGGQTIYEYLDAGGVDLDTSRGFSDNGANFSFTLNTATTYSATYGGANWNGTITNAGLDGIQVFNNNAGNGNEYNVFFNNLTVIPEPTSAALGLIGSLLLLRRRRD